MYMRVDNRGGIFNKINYHGFSGPAGPWLLFHF